MSKQAVSRRTFLRGSLMAMSGAVLAACTPAAPRATPAAVSDQLTAASATVVPATPAPTGPVSIDIWEQEISIELMKEVSQAYLDEHPEIRVNWVPTSITDTANKLLAALVAGAGAPDAAFIDYVNMVKFTTRGGQGLTDLSPWMEPRKGEWVDWCLDIVTVDGRILGLPEDLGLENVFYRRDVFEAEGLPSDPDSVAKALSTWNDYYLTGQEVIKGGNHWMLDSVADVFFILRQKTRQAFFDDNGEPIVNGADFVEAARFAKKLRDAGLDSRFEGPEWNAAMQQGKVATYLSACWFDQIIRPTAPETAGKWGVVPLPSKSCGNVGGSYFVIPEMSQKKEEAFRFVNFIEATVEGLDIYMKSGKFLPGWAEYYKASFFNEADPFYAGQVWTKLFADIVNNVPPIHLTTNDPIADEVVTQALLRVLEEGADPQQSFDQANEEIKQRIAG